MLKQLIVLNAIGESDILSFIMRSTIFPQTLEPFELRKQR